MKVVRTYTLDYETVKLFEENTKNRERSRVLNEVLSAYLSVNKDETTQEKRAMEEFQLQQRKATEATAKAQEAQEKYRKLREERIKTEMEEERTIEEQAEKTREVRENDAIKHSI